MDIKISDTANLPTKYAELKIKSFKEGNKEHLVIFKMPFEDVPLVRIHSECLTGDALGSLKCDCGEQLDYALEKISQNGGMIIYLRQEGRNIGLFNKVNAYALQDQGFDTIEANHQLGFKSDERDYKIVDFILDYFKIHQINLLTNNPEKIHALKGVQIVKRYPIIISSNKYNLDYLQTKKSMMGHMF